MEKFYGAQRHLLYQPHNFSPNNRKRNETGLTLEWFLYSKIKANVEDRMPVGVL